MSLIFNTKEELHLQMADLQQKLKKSEEERKKLERTCDALIRAFRENERMHCKALNNQYENFLEDCHLRKKRNDIILKSLCKVEDKAKSLFNKTEKLKLLKDRYTAYLRQNDFLKKEESKNEASLNFKTSNKGETSKSVHWKTPNLEDVMDDNIKDVNHLNDNSKDEPHLETSKKDINEKIFLNPSINNKQNNDLYKFLVENQNKNILENYTNHKEEESIQEENKNKSFFKNSDIYNKENENISNEIESEKSSVNVENAELIQSEIIRSEDEGFETASVKETFMYSKEKINDGHIINNNNNNTMNDNFLLKNATYKNVPDTFEKTSKHNSDISNLEIKMPWSTGNDQEEDKIEKKDFEGESVTSKIVKHQELYNESHEVTKNCSPDKNNLKDLILVKKTNRSLAEKTVIDLDETNYKKIFENDKSCSNNSDSSAKESDTSANEIEENIEESQNFTNYEFSSNNKIYPKGMDGIDYENETYPDSYYEQPEHIHNISSIASNVILEEDEYDLEGDHEKVLGFNTAQHLLTDTNIQPSEIDVAEKNYKLSNSSIGALPNQGDSYMIANEPLESQENNKFPENPIKIIQALNDNLDEFKNQDTDSEKSFKQQKETLFDSTVDESKSVRESNFFEDKENTNAEDNKNVTRSNLIHLLESDSESFQIEHGEPISGNEDSDFDFSFKI